MLFMTWFAHNIYCEGNSQVLAALKSNPALRNNIYWVKNLDDYAWFRPEIRHGLPPNGLIVVRPVCDLYSSAAAWYHDPVVSWYDVAPDPGAIGHSMRHDGEFTVYAPFLDFLQSLSAYTSTMVAYYLGATWGGSTEFEQTWVYTPDAYVYEHPVNTNHDGVEVDPFSKAPLYKMLAHFGVTLPTRYFALHTREFERAWYRYKV